MRRLFYAETTPSPPPPTFSWDRLLSLVEIALIAKRVFLKTLARSVNTSFLTNGHGRAKVSVIKKTVTIESFVSLFSDSTVNRAMLEMKTPY